MNSDSTESTRVLTSTENQTTNKKACLKRNKQEELEKKKTEIRSIFASQEFASMHSPTKRVIHYVLLQPKRNYPLVPKVLLFNMFNVDYHRYYQKEKKVRNGFPYELETKCPIMNEEEGKELLYFIRMNAERRTCMTIDQVVEKATEIVSRRNIALLFGAQLDRETVKDWCDKHGVDFKDCLTNYSVKALSDRESITQMYDNIHLMMQLWNYPPELIADMDETWVSTQDKVYSGKVAIVDGLQPIHISPADGAHITLIGCITMSGEVVTPSYILPEELRSPTRIEKNYLQNLLYWVNKSGFMNGDLFATWIEKALGPWFDKKRKHPLQHALLICDAHSSRTNVRARDALKRHMIDMIVLPAHVTSKHQPLDVGVYSPYKTALKKILMNVEGGLYANVWASINAFQAATIPINILNAWERSLLFSEDYKKVIDSYLPRLPNKKVSKNSNYIVPCERVERV